MEYDGPPYTITDFVFSTEMTDTRLSFVCNGKFFYLSFCAEDLDTSPKVKGQYLHYLQVAEAFELEDETVEDFYDWILEPFLPILKDIPPIDIDQNFSLDQYLFPAYTYYSVRADGERLVPVLTSFPKYKPDGRGTELRREDCLSFTKYRPQEVKITTDFFGENIPGNQKIVFVNSDTECFFKPYMYGDSAIARREIEAYKKIEDAGLVEELRISRLRGIVWDDAREIAFGLLLSYIDCDNLTLACAFNDNPPANLRQSWTNQVKMLVEKLHAAGLVWGDAKPDNVLIDKNENAWLIDFGGSYTEGWVDKDLAGTKEGDLQGLTRIIEYLETIG